MSILTRDAILEEMRKGNIVIEPFSEEQVGPGSVDLHLGNDFRVFKKVHRIVKVTEDIDYGSFSEAVSVEDGKYLVLMPNETILGITRERIRLSGNLCGWLEGRSRFARLGLLVHISASFMQPGIDNHQVLEMSNCSPMPLAIYPGTRICQFVFGRTEGSAIYEGKFKDQSRL
ncbi:MAG: dCTP deaminase [Candidatus Tritonobacter lacicola]|nr:dCTP deaminase [Candidatus Tritonobacter lacicola]